MVTTEIPNPPLVVFLNQFAELFPAARRNSLREIIEGGILTDAYLHLVHRAFLDDPNYVREEPVGRTACLKLVEMLLAIPEADRYQRVPRGRGHG